MAENSEVVDNVLDSILTQISVDVACGMHRAIKLGKISLAELRSPAKRVDLYSEVHGKSEQTMVESLERYATEEPLKKRLCIAAADDVMMDEDQDNEPEETATTAAIVTRHQQNHTDIYGRVPPKEPKALARCGICDRDVAATRFAPHLDKCMNLGTNRAASANTTGANPTPNGRGASSTTKAVK